MVAGFQFKFDSQLLLGHENRIVWKSFEICHMFKCFSTNVVQKISFFLSHKLSTRLLFKHWWFRWSDEFTLFNGRFHVPTCIVHIVWFHGFDTIYATSCYTINCVYCQDYESVTTRSTSRLVSHFLVRLLLLLVYSSMMGIIIIIFRNIILETCPFH